MYKKVNKCRICGNENLVKILDLGKQTLTGVFPETKSQKITCGPLQLVKCQEIQDGETCGLVQLRHSYDLGEMYGENYGYRSGLNKFIVDHLSNTVKRIVEFVNIKSNDIVIDIGSNDCTLLKSYPQMDLKLIGIDPTGIKFREYYPENVTLIPDFFSLETFNKHFSNKKAKVITSIAMFYDLENPLKFVSDIAAILDDNGVWVFEQSYMPKMLEVNAYDTVCHEHLEYYRLKQIKWMLDRNDLKILDIEFNDINGGSFSVMASKKNSPYKECTQKIVKILDKESQLKLHTLTPYQEFENRVKKHRKELLDLLFKLKKNGKKVFGYGASTKGNVVLQYCNITENVISKFAEINEYKFGRFTPGTLIPIISEKEAKNANPDYFLVLPWHFKETIIKKEHKYLNSGGKLLFPLPEIETYDV